MPCQKLIDPGESWTVDFGVIHKKEHKMIEIGKCYTEDEVSFRHYAAKNPILETGPRDLESFRNGWLVGRLRLREEQIEAVVTGLSQDVERVVEGCPRCGEPVDGENEYGLICADCFGDDVRATSKGK